MAGHIERNELIGRVNRGEMTPDEAEDEAKRQKLGPLSREPDPDDFDPSGEDQWTLPMAIAWIAYRDLSVVRDWWQAYREECWDWHFRRSRIGFDGPEQEGWFLEQRHRATLTLLRIADHIKRRTDRDPDFSLTVPEAIEALWVALRTDCFRASAVGTDGSRTAIPPLQWHQLKCIQQHDRDELHSDPPSVVYLEPLVPSASVRGLWPPPRPLKRMVELPDQIPPSGDGHMPLYCAAQWIATKGGAQKFDPEDIDIWRVAFGELLAAISSEKVQVIGTRNGAREPVPAFHFADCKVDYPFDSAVSIELILSEDLYLQSYAYTDDVNWRKGYDDSLMNRWETRWSRLMVRKSDILVLWPFILETPAKSGAPGRPTSIHLVLAELDRRAERGELASRVREQAKELHAWLGQNHPGAPEVTVKTIENRIRDSFRKLSQALK